MSKPFNFIHQWLALDTPETRVEPVDPLGLGLMHTWIECAHATLKDSWTAHQLLRALFNGFDTKLIQSIQNRAKNTFVELGLSKPVYRAGHWGPHSTTETPQSFTFPD